MDPINESYQKIVSDSKEENLDEMMVSKRATQKLSGDIYNFMVNMGVGIESSHIAGQQIGQAIAMAFQNSWDLATKEQKDAFKKFVVSGMDSQHF